MAMELLVLLLTCTYGVADDHLSIMNKIIIRKYLIF